MILPTVYGKKICVAVTIHQSEMLVIMATQIKTQFIVTPIMGNVRAGQNKFNNIDDTPLPKRKR